MKHKWLVWVGVILLPLVLFAGGKPNPGTKADKRLARNKPASKTPATVKSTAPYRTPTPPARKAK